MSFSFERLADYFTAVAVLGAEHDPVTQRAIAAQLGFVEEAPPARPQEVVAPPATLPSTPHTPAQRPDAATGGAAPAVQERSRPRQEKPSLSYSITRMTSNRGRPDWLEHVLPLPPPKSGGTTPPAPAPLLAQRWSRAILSTAMSRDTVTNTIDVDAIVDLVSRGMPIRRVPRRIVPTLTHGVQLLVDRGPSAAPFLGDQELLIQQIRAVAGSDRVQVLRFEPSRGFVAGGGSRRRWTDYFNLTPPVPGMTIVLISDIGITTVPHESNATPGEWQTFVARIGARGNRVIAFVPYAPSRWPRGLRGRLGMVPWDRNTSVQAVRRLLGRRGAKRPVTS
jgi:hypothetical protein